MKTLTRSYSGRARTGLLLAACLFVALSATRQAMAAPKSRQVRAAHVPDWQAPRGAARLVIRRSPDLGHNVIVRLFIDGTSTASIAYGHTYEHLIRPGTRLVSLLPTPDPRWPIPYNVRLNARSGRTYTLTVIDGGSGMLGVRRL